MCTILVAYATRAGSTREIAEAIADELRQTDHSVTLAPCDTAPDVDGFDAVVIGSALYTGRWLPAANRYLLRQAPVLATRPTFLFQSGPCGPPSHSLGATPVPRTVRTIARRRGLTQPTTFAGRLDPTMIAGRIARWIASAAPTGDFRDWDSIRAWGYAIGTELHEHPVRRRTPRAAGEHHTSSGSR
jgi:menaquinone-dependent protoporphyrinogen oxidase